MTESEFLFFVGVGMENDHSGFFLLASCSFLPSPADIRLIESRIILDTYYQTRIYGRSIFAHALNCKLIP